MEGPSTKDQWKDQSRSGPLHRSRRARSHCVIFSDCDCDLFFAYNGLYREFMMLSQSHSVNTSIESRPISCDKKNRSRNQKKNVECERAFTIKIKAKKVSIIGK